MQGILYYNPGGNVGGQTEANLTGGATQNLAGGIYVPNGDLNVSGNPSSSCSIFVADSVSIAGDTSVAHAGCANIGTNFTDMQRIVLVE